MLRHGTSSDRFELRHENRRLLSGKVVNSRRILSEGPRGDKAGTSYGAENGFRASMKHERKLSMLSMHSPFYEPVEGGRGRVRTPEISELVLRSDYFLGFRFLGRLGHDMQSIFAGIVFLRIDFLVFAVQQLDATDKASV